MHKIVLACSSSHSDWCSNHSPHLTLQKPKPPYPPYTQPSQIPKGCLPLSLGWGISSQEWKFHILLHLLNCLL